MYALRQAFTTMLLALACTANAETITGLDCNLVQAER